MRLNIWVRSEVCILRTWKGTNTGSGEEGNPCQNELKWTPECFHDEEEPVKSLLWEGVDGTALPKVIVLTMGAELPAHKCIFYLGPSPSDSEWSLWLFKKKAQGTESLRADMWQQDTLVV